MLLREFLGIREAVDDRALRRLDPLAAARRRLVGQLPRRPGRALDDDRGLRRAAPRRRRPRRRAHARRGRVRRASTAASSARACSRTSGWRCSARGRGSDVPGAAARADAAARVGAAQHLRLRLLGAPDGRRDVDRAGGAPDPLAAVHARRAARRRAVARARAAARPTARALGGRRPRARRSTAGGRCAALREAALARAERWIVRRQEADGSWGGIQPPWVYSLIALHLRGYPTRPPGDAGRPRRARALHDRGGAAAAASRPASRRSGTPRSPSSRSRTPASPPTIRRSLRAADWLLDEQVPLVGDWAVRRPALRPGGWSFEFANDYYPDVDDTAEVVLALLRVAHPDRERVAQRDRARASTGSRGCRTAAAAGARSTPRTPSGSCATCRSATSAR